VSDSPIDWVGISFFILTLYVAFEAGKSLLHREEPDTSVVGIVLSIVSLIVMPLLARAKRRVAAKIESRALHADSRQTDICAYLSAILLGGLLLNALFGWWWADPNRRIMHAANDYPRGHGSRAQPIILSPREFSASQVMQNDHTASPACVVRLG
jgi:Co/Zn/Cd efflux system component